MGGTLNKTTVPRLRAKIVCGAANNQLGSPEVGAQLLERGIVYAPDYVVNAGGILNASGDFFGHYDVEDVWRKVNAIGETVSGVLDTAARQHRPTQQIADELAESILSTARRNRRAQAEC